MVTQKWVHARLVQVSDYYNKAFGIIEESITEHALVTETATKLAARLREKGEKLAEEVVARLHAEGLSDKDGLNCDQAHQEFFRHPLFAKCNLFDLGNGEW